MELNINKPRHKTTISDPAMWVDEHGDYLFRFALSRLRNPELAENAVQETFLAAITSKETFSGRSSERTWLVGILKHKIIDHFRKIYREIPVTDLQKDEDCARRSHRPSRRNFIVHSGRSTSSRPPEFIVHPALTV